MRRLWALAGFVGLFAVAAFGQTSTVFVTAQNNYVIAGAQIQLTPSAQDRNSAPVNNVTFAWSSSDAATAPVDSKGNVSGVKPGFVTITAAVGNIRGSFQVQVVPLRIDVTPQFVQLKIGDQQQFSASALDINQQPIANAVITWQIAGSNGNFTAAATIDNNGLLTTVAANTVTVRAVIAYSGLPNGFASQYIGLATAYVLPPADYRLRRLLTTGETRSSFRILARRGGIAANDSGQLAIVGALDGVSNGVLLNDNGAFQMLLSGGSSTLNPGGNMIDFEDPVINNAGQVAVRADSIGQSGTIFLLSKTDALYAVTDGTVLPGYGDLESSNIARFSLNDNGTILFRASFIFDSASTRSTGLFDITGNRTNLDVYSPGKPPPGLNDPFTFDTDFGIDNQGSIYFSAFDGKNREVLQLTSDGAFHKAIATGDALSGSTVRNIFRFGVSTAGDLAIGFDTNANLQYILRYTGGDLSKPPEILPLNGFNQVYAMTSAGVLFAGNGTPGFGLYLWPPGASAATAIMVTARPSPSGAEIIEIQGAGMNSAGTVFAKLRTAASPLELVKYAAGKAILMFQSGDPVAVAANLCVRGLVPGATAGNPHPFMGGYQSSIFEIDPTVGLLPRIVMGDQFDIAPFYGNLPVRKSPNGTLYAADDDGLFRVSASGVDTIVRVPQRDADGVTQTGITGANESLNGTITSGGLTANDSGAVAWISETNQSHRRLYLSSGGKIQTLAFIGTNAAYRTASPAGGYFSDFQEIAIDNNATSPRVMARFTVNGGPSGYFLWANGAWQAAALFGQTKIPDTVVDSGYELKCAGGDFFAIFVQQGTPSVLARYNAAGWTPVFAINQNIPTGTFLANFRSLAVNRAGEVAFYGSADGGIPIIVAITADNTAHLVYTGTDMTPDGGFLVNITQIEFRDDHRVYFTAFDIWDRVDIYVAEPLF